VHSFFAELKRRGVLKVATAYLVVSWLVLEVGHTLFLIFELPHLGMQVVFVLLALGFPVAIGAAWQYRFAAADHPEEHAHESHDGSQLAIVFAVVAVFVICTVIVMRFLGYERHGGGHGEPLAEAHAPAADTHATGAAAAGPFTPPEHSVAVMPFVNMSGDAKDEYFADGLSEELLNSLARINELQVAARTSSFSFKGTPSDIPAIGRKLNVAAVLEGSVRKAGQQVRITAQLVNAVNGYRLWTATFDRELKDIFALQTEIATAVTDALKLKLLPADKAKVVLGGTQNPAAYDVYLRGMGSLSKAADEAGVRSAVAAFGEALRLDPDFALAYAARANVRTNLATDWTADANETKLLHAAARADADRAVKLAPMLGAAYEARARHLWGLSLNFAAAEADARRAIELEPGSLNALSTFTRIASSQGRTAEALETAGRAVQLDPLSYRAWRLHGIQLYAARRYEDARTSYKRALALQPANLSTQGWMALSELMSGNPEEAIALCEPDSSWNGKHCLAIAYYKVGRREEAAQLLRALRKEFGDSLAYQYAQVYAQWGQPQQALEWLVSAVRLKDPGLAELRTDPLLDPIRNTPQFKEAEQRLAAME
jgi:TolB-like protein